MRDICLITEELAPVKYGGIGEWSRAIATELSLIPGNRVTVFLKKHPQLRTYVKTTTLSYPIVSMTGWKWTKYRKYYIYFHIKKFVRQHPGAIIIATKWSLAEKLSTLKSKYNCHLFTIAHGKEVTRLYHSSDKRRLKMEQTYQASDGVIAVSEFTKNHILALCKNPLPNLTVLNNGADIRQLKPLEPPAVARLRLRYAINDSTFVLITLARVIPRKGHDIVIEAISRIIEKHPDILYLIVGNGSEKWIGHLKTLTADKNLSNHVRFLGPVNNDERTGLLNLSDCFIMVCHAKQDVGDSEGFGISFLEANACQIPVIGSDTGGVPEAIAHNQSGLLVPPDDINATAAVIEKLLCNPQYRKNLGLYGRLRVENEFAWPIIAKRLWQIIVSTSALPETSE
ncbi:MAG: glycosyltransferase family 4 protein [Candidatus Marinimicrobia bacterium]|jgi:phosphatidylinositol alpha-1,6-mannosyltransferase|nr:glycosyltransferase family 4 protein [Candidatus Neomarinimicrobiota bacterium]MCK9482868.1 glycosyltransferase family 4 protein [Candidatus Neomarinimicrobiota bacterium]MCK9558829.1 glycosyltransferase family 4 protein [Candidatus Neomarinimicrobiota bacterium]MDD5062100.1 glycosyltransferase family 4 protein [Candidatus Neomarinimicrobiota bacterium]MDD5230247.1 glycosyltransferase family 4 protein [Candidatus Neomarinimicrobiota bacterium]